MQTEPDDILAFWFTPPVNQQWFNAPADLDQQIRKRFEPSWEAAVAGRLDQWRQTPEGCLALVILLDQFPLNMFRGQARAFASEAQAREVARYAIAQGFEQSMPAEQQGFLYMPFMHSESLSDQALSVQLYEQAGLQDNLRFARHHQQIIQRFGRFPHRNALLGRQSSEAELGYLASDEAFKG